MMIHVYIYICSVILFRAGYRIVAKFIPDSHGSGKSSDVPFYPVSVELPSKKGLGESKIDGVNGSGKRMGLFLD